MDYEKKYKESLKVAKEIHKFSSDIAEIKRMEQIFPELVESEDERIRKALLEMVHDTTGDELWIDYDVHKEETIAWLEKQGDKLQGKAALEAAKEEKVDNIIRVEPKFKVGDWVIDKQGIVHQIANVIENVTYHTCGYDVVGGGYFNDNTESIRLWTIADAKDGDVLSDGTTIFIFKDLLSDGSVMSYCDYDTDSDENDAFCPSSVNLMCSKIIPATNKQRELLFAKMREAGYEWDAEKKELKEIEHNEDERIRNWLIGYFRQYKEDGIEKYANGLKVESIIAWLEKQGDTNETINRDEFVQAVLRGAAINLITWIDYNAAEGNMCLSNVQCKDIENALVRGNWNKIYGYMKKKLEKQAQKPKWTDEDASKVKEIVYFLDTAKVHYASTTALDDCIEWLKSLKQK